MAQSLTTSSLLAQGAPVASKCGDVNSASTIKIVNPDNCSIPDSYGLENVTAAIVADETINIAVATVPAGAATPTVVDPFIIYAGTVLTFLGTPNVEVTVLERVAITAVGGAGVAARVKPLTAALTAGQDADLYRFHVLTGVQTSELQAADESEDVTTLNDGIQKAEDVTARGKSLNISSFINISDEGLFRALLNNLNNGGQRALTSIYGVPGLFTVGDASYMNGSISRNAKSKAKLSADIMFQPPFVDFVPLQYEPATRATLLREYIRLWGYSVADF